MPSLSEQALQMESLISTLLPFKRKEIARLTEHRLKDLENTGAWWDTIIENCREEVRILEEHSAALGMSDAPAPLDPVEAAREVLKASYSEPLMTPDEKARVASLVGIKME